MRIITSFILVLLVFSCQSIEHEKLMQGHYRATLEVQDGRELPFNFKVRNDDKIEIYNAEEVILADEIIYKNDSVRINFPVYEGYIAGRFERGRIHNAQYVKESLDRYVPFKAQYDISDRFLNTEEAQFDAGGIWEMLFTEDDGNTFIAKGIFEQSDGKLTGTIRTTTGDYRFLEGVVDGEELLLSVFDGAHAFLFTATLQGENLNGYFYSGNHYKASFTAFRNADFELPHEDTLTYLNPGYDRVEFSFPDSSGKMVSLSDEQFQNKVVVVQIMGTWCPNCLDESTYYSNFYREQENDELAFVALAFEYAKTEAAAFAGIERLKQRLDIQYPILLAQYGSSSKVKAQEKLPMLNHVLSYPTSIFIDKKGEVRKIHTGFNGPATGEKYEAFKSEFTSFVNLLLNE